MLLVFPPQWTPVSPHFAVPSLIGQLKNEGFNAFALDLNIEFYHYILDRNYIQNSLDKIKVQFEEAQKKIVKIYSPSKKEADYSFEEKMLFYKYNKLKNFISLKYKDFSVVPNFINSAMQTFNTQEFYNPVSLIKSMNVIDKALEIISLQYAPLSIGFDSVINPFFKFNYESIKYFVLDKNTNIFSEFYEKQINSILEKDYGFIAISINSSSQIVAGLTLAYMLK